MVAKSKWTDVDQLLVNVQRVGKRLVQAAPRELVIANIVRRVLGLIRDEACEDRNEEFGSESLSDIQAAPPPSRVHASGISRPIRPQVLSATSSFMVPKTIFSLLEAPTVAESTGTASPVTGASTPVYFTQHPSVHALRSEVIEGIEEIMDEIDQVDDQIAAFAELQIHPGDYILVHQPSPTVEKFLVRAAAKRKFTVLITGDELKSKTGEAPYAAFRKKLGGAGVKAVNIMSSSTMAYMPRASKVILGARAVTASGGVVSDGGSGLVARAAHECAKTVVVLSGVYKISPEDPTNIQSPVELGDPSKFVDFADGDMVNGVTVESAATDFIPPSLVDIYITNL